MKFSIILTITFLLLFGHNAYAEPPADFLDTPFLGGAMDPTYSDITLQVFVSALKPDACKWEKVSDDQWICRISKTDPVAETTSKLTMSFEKMTASRMVKDLGVEKKTVEGKLKDQVMLARVIADGVEFPPNEVQQFFDNIYNPMVASKVLKKGDLTDHGGYLNKASGQKYKTLKDNSYTPDYSNPTSAAPSYKGK